MLAAEVDLRGLDALNYLDANCRRDTTLTGFQMQQLAAVIAAGLGFQIED